MKLHDLKVGKSLYVFLASLSLMVLVSGVSVWNTIQVSTAYSGAKNEVGLKRLKTYRAIEDADYLVNNHSGFKDLNDRGVIGVVDAIVWIEAFEAAREEMLLTELYYDIGQPVTLSGNHGGRVAIQVVTIDLQIGFTHDEALFTFFDLLNRSIDLNHHVTLLEIERVVSDQSQKQVTPVQPVNLVATSQISWISILPLDKSDALDVNGV